MKSLISIFMLVLWCSLGTRAGERIIYDDLGRKICLSKEPKRIISLAPGITEIIFALGEDRKLVGRTNFCDYPAQAKKVAAIGNLIDPNLEKIVSLDPDIVIVSTHFTTQNIHKLEKMGVQVAALFSEDSFEGLDEIIRKIGSLLDCKKKSEVIIARNRNKVSAALGKVMKGKQKVNLYYAIGMGKGGDFTAPGNSAIGRFIKLAGAVNIAETLDGWKYSLEQLLTKDPDIIICPKSFGYKEMFYSLPGYKTLKAVKNRKVYEIDNNRFDRLTPRTVDGLIELIDIVNKYKIDHV